MLLGLLLLFGSANAYATAQITMVDKTKPTLSLYIDGDFGRSAGRSVPAFSRIARGCLARPPFRQVDTCSKQETAKKSWRTPKSTSLTMPLAHGRSFQKNK